MFTAASRIRILTVCANKHGSQRLRAWRTPTPRCTRGSTCPAASPRVPAPRSSAMFDEGDRTRGAEACAGVSSVGACVAKSTGVLALREREDAIAFDVLLVAIESSGTEDVRVKAGARGRDRGRARGDRGGCAIVGCVRPCKLADGGPRLRASLTGPP